MTHPVEHPAVAEPFATGQPTTTLSITKHHGLGNDFLVCLASTPQAAPWRSALARRCCDRRRGIGADGMLFLAGVAQDQWIMELYNADGSRAEMSGNGIRCFVQALALDQAVTRGIFPVLTDAGLRVVELSGTDDPFTVMASVSMGSANVVAEPAGWEQLECDPMRPVSHLSMGNPHSVVAVDDVTAVDLLRLGALVPQVNLEIVEAGPEPHAITMRVHERGAGITQACGTGAAAAASVAASWGLAKPNEGEILVHMDGGDARVNVEGPQLLLTGPSVFIATIEIAVAMSAEGATA
ncbi:MAG: dapF [Acidimicrobiia bacterium]|nr:dapF [Acidimicrobiia bacterium]